MGRINQLVIGQDALKQYEESQILLIGVGGIGCEVLKVICKFPFAELHILDLDTIEVSNLNRQFLFRKQHRGKFKAHVARETILAQYPHLKIFSHNSDIRSQQYGMKFFQNFNLVIMALDNTETRSYVNQMCINLNIIVLDAGTLGYQGQAFLIQRGISRCYDCLERDNSQNQSYPACTIRTLPEQPVHCIVWAKFLFGILFGPADDDSNLLQDMKSQLISVDGLSSPSELCFKVIEKLYQYDILKQKESGDATEKSINMRPIEVLEALPKFLQESYSSQLLQNNLKYLQNTHDLPTYLKVFQESYLALSNLKLKEGFVTFEKDDPIIIKFISAASNLRAHVFHIELTNEFQVKEISGNIIPAIASTNAIVASIEISELIKYFLVKASGLSSVDLQKLPKNLRPQELYIQNDLKTKIIQINAQKPNAMCIVCSEDVQPDIAHLNFKTSTLKSFIEQIFQDLEDDDKLENFSISAKEDIIFEHDAMADEDELENSEKQQSKTIFEIFKSLCDIRLTVTNQDSGLVYGFFILANDDSNDNGQIQITRNHQKKGSRELDLKKYLIANKMNSKDDIEVEEEKQDNNKSQEINKNGVIQLDDEDQSDDDIIMECDNTDSNKNKELQVQKKENLQRDRSQFEKGEKENIVEIGSGESQLDQGSQKIKPNEEPDAEIIID